MFNKRNKCREQASTDFINKNNGLPLYRVFWKFTAPGILQTAVHYANSENHSAIQPVFKHSKPLSGKKDRPKKIGPR